MCWFQFLVPPFCILQPKLEDRISLLGNMINPDIRYSLLFSVSWLRTEFFIAVLIFKHIRFSFFFFFYKWNIICQIVWYSRCWAVFETPEKFHFCPAICILRKDLITILSLPLHQEPKMLTLTQVNELIPSQSLELSEPGIKTTQSTKAQ